MKKLLPVRLFFFAALLFSANFTFGQGAPACPSVVIAPPASICAGSCTTLTSTLVTNNQTTSYSVAAIPYVPYSYTTGTSVLVSTDDVWSPLETIGFNFCYFGNTYGKFVIGSNGQITFNAASASAYDGWSNTTALPSTTDMPGNTISCPFRDIDPGIPAAGESVKFQMYGTAPCRALVVSWNNIPLFDKGSGTCNGTPNSTFQCVLYENTNYIDVYIDNSYSCAAWNGGFGTIGIQNAAATVAVCPAGRNHTTFSVNGTPEAWRFTPIGAPSYSLNWYVVGSGTSLGTTSTLTVCPTVTTSYAEVMKVTNCDGTSFNESDTVQVIVNPAPTVTASASASPICIGSSSVLTAGGATTYSWSPGGSTTNPLTVTPGSTTTYTVTGTKAGCTGTATVTVVVNPTLTITASAAPTPICPGNSSVLTATGPAGTTYSWSPGGATTNPVTVTPGTTTTYTVTGNNAGCTGTATVTVTVSPNIVVTANAAPTPICVGSSSILTATGPGGTTYSWSTGATTNPLAVTPGTTTTYTVTGNSGGCTGTATVTVTVNPLPTVTVNSPTICAGTSATLTGAGATTYNWNTGGTTNPLIVTPATTTSYTVTGTDANGCTGSAIATVTVNPLPTVTVNSPTICAGTSATLTGNGGTTYSWSTGATTNPITVTPAATTSYTVTGTDANGCTGTAIATVTVAPSLAVTITPSPVSICVGTSATLTGNGGTTYSWSTGATTNPITVTPAATTTYTVTGTTGGCTGTATVTVTVNPLPTVTVNSPTICAGTSATLTGAGATTYNWNTGGTTNPLIVTPATTTSYTVTGTDANGCTGSAIATVTVNPLPTVTVNSPTICAGTSATLTGNGGTTYSWSTGATTNPITVTPAATTSYTVTGTDANGCTGTAIATVTVAPSLAVTITPSPVSICVGTSATLTGNGGTTYSWSTGATTNPITVTPAATTTYTVTGTTGGCTGTSTVTVTVDILQASAAGFPATCHGSCNGYAVVIPSGGMGAYIYSWTPSGNTTANANNLCSGTYCIKVTDANGCIVDTCVTVTSPTAISLVTSTMTSHCGQADGSATVTASGGTPATIGPGYTYLWTPSGQATATATGLTPGNYCVTVKDTNNCPDTICVVVPDAPGVVASISGSTNVSCFGTCDGTATGLATGGTAPYTYSWSTVPSQATATATGLCAGLYTVSISDGTGCNSSASVTITQPTQVTVTPSAAITICIGQSTTLSATALGGTPAYNYTWNTTVNGQDYTVSPTTSPTTYTVVATDANGCQSTPQTVTVTLNPPLSVTAEHDTSLCLGGHATLTAQGTGGNGSYNYVWQPGALSGSPISVTPTATTTYTVTVTDNCGTPPATNTVTVTVNPLPTVSFSADSVSGCYPLCVTFSNLSTPASASANWEFGDGNTASTTMTGHNCYETSGSYNVTLTVTDSLGCSNTSTINNMILVYPHPTANFSMSPTPVTILEPTVYFTDASTGGVTEWEWNMGDVPNSGSNVENPQYTYPDTGYYNVELIVTDNHGCKDSITKTVYVEGEYVIYVPNAFTPNGDGINDTFYPKGTGIDPNNYQMYIFDRWGNMIFYTNILSQGWDGRVQGDSKLVQEDVYVWKIITKDPQGKSHQYIGHVSVVR